MRLYCSMTGVVIMKMMRRENAKSINGVTLRSEMTASLFFLLKSRAIGKPRNPFQVRFCPPDYWQNFRVSSSHLWSFQEVHCKQKQLE